MYDIIIIGGGPAGLTAALYARRANKTVLVLEKGCFGGQITYSPKVENIPGFLEITGNEFADKLVEQVLAQEADVDCSEVLEIRDGDIKTVITSDGEHQGKTLIIATGAKHRMLGLPGEQELVGEGISFCAVCDGAFYENKTVAVVGGGNSALQEAILLSELASKVYVIQNMDDFTGEKKLVDILTAKTNVEVILGTEVVQLQSREGSLTGVTIRSTHSGEQTEIAMDGLFIAIGLIPQNEIFSDIVELNPYGYVEAEENCHTSAEGVFVAGDCRSKRIRQVTTATGDGAIAAMAACEYIDKKGCQKA